MLSTLLSRKLWIPLSISLTVLFLFLKFDFSFAPEHRRAAAYSEQLPVHVQPYNREVDVGLVVAKAEYEDVGWIEDFCLTL